MWGKRFIVTNTERRYYDRVRVTSANDNCQVLVDGVLQATILHLVVNYDAAIDTTVVACEAFEWFGETYTFSGYYEQLLQTIEGCDSIVSLDLTIGHAQQLTLQGPQLVYVATSLISGIYDYYVSDSSYIEQGALVWSCSNPEWMISPSESTFGCQLWVTNIGQGMLMARTDEGCETVFTLDIVADWFDLEENNCLAVKVFPNPALSEVTVQAEEITRIRLMDACGQVVVDENYGRPHSIILNTSHLSQGVYLMEITTTQGKTVRRLVVQGDY